MVLLVQLRRRLAAWRRPETLLLLMAAAVPLSFDTWAALLNNFAIERAAFSGAEIGILQSLREIPGFLAFAVVFLLLLVREQALAYISLAVLGIGTAMTGWFPSIVGLYCTTVLMSLGFHYYETIQISLSLQWIDKRRAPETLGRVIAVGAFTSIVIYGLVWLAFDRLHLDFRWIYMIGGGLTVGITVFVWTSFPRYPAKVEQHKGMVLRSRYWLYYALTFMSGARRQIFIVFAGFLMVEKFKFDVGAISLLFLINATVNVLFARRIGRLVGRLGERRALLFEYTGLIGVFTAYAFVSNATLAAGLYIVDHAFFALAIAIKTYFQKIADPADIASTAGVGFTINHIAAVILPAALGVVWLVSPAAVFLVGSGMAVLSLLLSMNIPTHPAPGNEVIVTPRLAFAPR
ncbi:MAG: MFS transporter [Gammaproteobacteria bacterium]|nr:MFS transporter [Gammaproteobacteria bacterium]MDH3464699.1 MFS transporter [Gammaproteobacteria bacterium]